MGYFCIMKKIVIAIDGFSSTGKSTIAKQLAKALGYIYVDTGAMYRAITLYALQQGFIKDGQVDVDGLIAALEGIAVAFVRNTETDLAEMHLNGTNVEREIRAMDVSRQVSKIAAIPEVRTKLVALQQEMGKNKGLVMDGRDIGTVVFPEAELKIFMSASPEARASRRYRELLLKGEKVTYEEVLENVQDRDYRDSHRAVAPLRKAEGAIPFDNSDMGLEEQFDRIYAYAMRVIEAQ